jgi:hypothetical protein
MRPISFAMAPCPSPPKLLRHTTERASARHFPGFAPLNPATCCRRRERKCAWRAITDIVQAQRNGTSVAAPKNRGWASLGRNENPYGRVGWPADARLTIRCRDDPFGSFTSQLVRKILPS